MNTSKKILFSLILALFLGSNSAIYVSFAEETAKEAETLFMAQKAYEDGFYDASLGLLESFFKNYPDSSQKVEANLLAGQCYLHKNNFEAAQNKLEELLNDPQAKSVKDSLYFWIGEVNFKRNNFLQACAHYKKIIEEFPSSSYCPAAYYSLGWCLFQERKYKEAIECFTNLSDKFPKEPQSKDAAFKLIECLYNLKDYAGLKQKAAGLIPIFSKDSLRLSYLYFYLAEADYYMGNYTQAEGAYKKVLVSNHEEKMQALAKLDLAWTYLKLKQYKEAEDIFQGLKPDDLEKRSQDIYLLGKAMLFAETNRLSQAKELYRRLSVQATDPMISIQGYIGMADALFNLADYAQASSAYREALSKLNLQITPAQVIERLNYNLSCSLLKQLDTGEAIKGFQKVIASTNDPDLKIASLYQIGDAYQGSADYLKAQESYSLLLDKYPDSAYSDYAFYQLSSVYIKDAQIEKAITNLSIFGKKFPASKFLDDATYTLGLAYFKKQDYQAAQSALKKFQNEFKDSDLRPKALYLLGNCFYNSADYPAAIQAFKEVSKISGLEQELAQKAEYAAADSLYQMGQAQEALEKFKALRSKYSDSKLAPSVILWLGDYYYRHNEPELAGRYFLSLIQDFPSSDLTADAYYSLGLIYLDGVKPQEALESFQKALSLAKSELRFKVLLAIADLDNKSGDYRAALDSYNKALESVSAQDLAGIHIKIAEIQEVMNKFDEAINEYLEAIRLSGPLDTLTLKAMLRLARIYEDKSNFEEALAIYNKILKLDIPESRYAQEQINRIKQE